MKLLEFPHSHYCEKARFALDYKGVTYERVSLMPGLHVHKLKRIVPGTSVPVLLDGEVAIQGSSAIIDHLDQTISGHGLTPTDARERKECQVLEEEFDRVFGQNIRRALYLYLLPHSGFVRHCFMSRSPLLQRCLFTAAFPFLRHKLVSAYGVTEGEVQKGLEEMEEALERWDEILEPGRFLVGERFTRADLSLASMLYFAGLPDDFESPWPAEPPNERVRVLLESLRERPTLKWVAHIYRTQRVGFTPFLRTG